MLLNFLTLYVHYKLQSIVNNTNMGRRRAKAMAVSNSGYHEQSPFYSGDFCNPVNLRGIFLS